MYIKNNEGPRMFPYRMSTFTFLEDENLPFKLFWVIFNKSIKNAAASLI